MSLKLVLHVLGASRLTEGYVVGIMLNEYILPEVFYVITSTSGAYLWYS